MKNIFSPEEREELQAYKEQIDIRNYLEISDYVMDESRNTRRTRPTSMKRGEIKYTGR